MDQLKVLKKNLRLLCIIPARKGSKSVSEKNLQVINPNNRLNLIHRAFKAALTSRIFNEIVITTDYRRGVLPSHGCTFIDRPRELCGDGALMKDVVSHVLSTLKTSYDFFFLLQPSSPFRFRFHFADLLKKLNTKYLQSTGEELFPNSIISLGPVDSESHPNRCGTIKNEQFYPLRHSNFKNKQDLMPMWKRNGAYYICNIDEFKKRKDFYLKPCVAYKMNEAESINIDSQKSLKAAIDVIRTGKLRDEI